jgi:hypothetical protein
MFGPTPWEIQQAQQQGLQSQAAAYAQLTPLQRAAQGMFTAGGQLGNIVAPAMGGVNPQMQMAQQTQDAAKSIDVTTSDGLMQAAARFKDVNPTIAAGLVAKAQAMKAQESTIALQAAQAKKALAYQPAGYGNTKEYQDQVDIITDPDSTPEEVQFAKDRIAALNTKATGKAGNSGTIKRMATSIGEVVFDPTTRKYTFADGSDIPPDQLRTMMPIGNDPKNAADVAGAKAGAKAVGAEAGLAQISLPKMENDISTVKDLGAKLFAHPGYQSLVGAGFPGLQKLAGSSVPGAKSFYDQIQGIGYLLARQELRGQGQVTENEANAALSAFSRMNVAMSEADFKDAYDEFVKRLDNIKTIMVKKAGMSYQMPSTPTTPVASMSAPADTAVPRFSGIETPQQVRVAYQSGKLSKIDANRILDDMKSRGLF